MEQKKVGKCEAYKDPTSMRAISSADKEDAVKRMIVQNIFKWVAELAGYEIKSHVKLTKKRR